MIRVALTFGISGVGAVLFHLAGLPLPWLLGPVAVCLIAALSGVQMGGITPLNDGMRTILGVAVGATFTPVVLASMARWSAGRGQSGSACSARPSLVR